MRVAIVHETIDRLRGGAESSVLEMASALGALGMDVTLVYRTTGKTDIESTEAGVRSVGLAAPFQSRLQRARGFLTRADEHLAERRYDVVHAITPCVRADVYQPRGGTFPATVRGNLRIERDPLRRAIKWIDRRLNRRQRMLLRAERALLTRAQPPYVACVSQLVADQIATDFPHAAARARVIFNAVTLEPVTADEKARAREYLCRNVDLDPAAPQLLFVAHNFKLKGLFELLRALAMANQHLRRKPVLLIVGRDNARSAQHLARSLGITPQIRFMGSVPDLRPLYASADVCVHPTWYDPCSRVVLEALLCGLPSITTRFNGAAEIIDPELHGLVIDSPRDHGALAEGILRCLQPALREDCHRAANALRGQLSMTRHARELVELYRTVAAERAASTSP